MAVISEIDQLRWSIDNPLIRGKYYPDQRVSQLSKPIQNVLAFCESCLKPGWEHSDTLLTHEDDLAFASNTHQRELSLVFQDLKSTSLKEVSDLCFEDITSCLAKPLDLLSDEGWNIHRWEIRTVDQQINQCLDLVPYQIDKSYIGFNRFGPLTQIGRPFQMGIIVFEFDLIDANHSRTKLEREVNLADEKLRNLRQQLTNATTVASRTGRL